MWIRFALKSDFIYVPKVTSKYLVPYKSKNKSNRDQTLKKAKKGIRKKAWCLCVASRCADYKQRDGLYNQSI